MGVVARRSQLVNVDEDVLAEAQELARVTGLSLDDVVERALILHVGARAPASNAGRVRSR